MVPFNPYQQKNSTRRNVAVVNPYQTTQPAPRPTCQETPSAAALEVPSHLSDTTSWKHSHTQQQPIPRPVSMDERERAARVSSRNPYFSATSHSSGAPPRSPRNHEDSRSRHTNSSHAINARSQVQGGQPTASTIPVTTALQLLHQERAQQASDPLFLLLPPSPALAASHILHPPPPQWLALHAGIHELSGPAGTGKTQLALTACRQAAASSSIARERSDQQSHHNMEHPPPATVRAIYISLRQHHLQKVAVRLQQMCCESNNNNENDNCILLERILTKGCTTPEDLLELLRDTIPRTIMNIHDTNTNNKLRLIVLDSVADLFRLDTLDIPTRSALLFQVTAALQDLVLLSSQQSQQPLSILVLNQVTANFAATGNTAKQQQPPASSASSLAQQQSYNHTRSCWIPALGLSWAHCVHSRYQVDRCAHGSTNGVARRRRLVLTHSARHATPTSAAFGIAQGGCEMLPP